MTGRKRISFNLWIWICLALKKLFINESKSKTRGDKWDRSYYLVMVAGETRPVHLFLSFWLHFYVFALILLALTKFEENHRFFCNLSVIHNLRYWLNAKIDEIKFHPSKKQWIMLINLSATYWSSRISMQLFTFLNHKQRV